MQDVTIAGAVYANVPSITVPTTVGDLAVFVDISDSVIDAESITVGHTAYDATGAKIAGTFIPRQKYPYEYDYVSGYVNNNTWTYQDSVNNHSDAYELEVGHIYVLMLGHNTGTRFRAVQIPSDPIGSLTNITGTNIIARTNPAANASVTFTATYPYMIVTKDNVGTAGYMSYLIDITVE